MKRFLLALTLTCVLSVSALAGTIPTCGGPEPAPGDVPHTAPGQVETPGAPGDMGAGGLALLIIDLLF